jgi:uncharacterized protein YnzC (UPF0291/DUF896 family)
MSLESVITSEESVEQEILRQISLEESLVQEHLAKYAMYLQMYEDLKNKSGNQ